jgi:UDP-glucose 4-epimerase
MFKLTGNVLLTGASGFVGQHLLKKLLTYQDLKVYVISRQSPFIEHPNLIWIQESLAALASSKNIASFKDIYFDYVFHLGAFTPKNRSDADAVDSIYHSNLIGSRVLYESLPQTVGKIIFASTLDVYQDIPNALINEQTQIAPVSLYGASKFFGEQLTYVYAKQLKALPIIMRYGHIYGPGEFRYQKLIPELIRKMLKAETISIQNDGSALRDFLYINDLVDLTLALAAKLNSNVGPINIVSGQSVSIKTIVEKLARLINFKSVIHFDVSAPPGRSLKFNNAKIKQILGEINLTSLDEGLKKQCDDFATLMGLA